MDFDLRRVAALQISTEHHENWQNARAYHHHAAPGLQLASTKMRDSITRLLPTNSVQQLGERTTEQARC